MAAEGKVPVNQALWRSTSKSQTLEVGSAPYTRPSTHEIVVKNGALAINPADWIILTALGNIVYPWIKYPFVHGTDVAGEVVEIGTSVTRFQAGDRVVGHAIGTSKNQNTSAKSAFQLYTVLLEHMVSPIPNTLSYEHAAVIPLGLSTAACGLFQHDQLGLQLPTSKTEGTGETVIIWGGSSSVGSNAIQLAVAAGYEVIATCSPKNFEYTQGLGANFAFDYKSNSVVDDIIQALNGKTVAGALTIGAGGADACFRILQKSKGNKFISMVTYPVPKTLPKRFVLLQTIFAYVTGNISAWFKGKTRGIRYNFVFADTLVENGVGKAIYEDYLPQALADGTFIAAPEPQVIGKGLESIPKGLDVQKQGMSAKKVVVSL